MYKGILLNFIVTLVFIIVYLIFGWRSSICFYAMLFNLTISICSFFYYTIGWKWAVLQMLSRKENLNGTWFGVYKSINNLNNDQYFGEIAIVIKQSYFDIKIKSHTKDYISFSYGASTLYDAQHDINRIVYLYSQTDTHTEFDNQRKGSSDLRLVKGRTEKKLNGYFWTNQNTIGSLDLVFVNSKHFEDFIEIKKSLV